MSAGRLTEGTNESYCSATSHHHAGDPRFFDDLVTALASQAALTAGYVTHASGRAYRFLDDSTLRLGCLTRREGKSTLEVEVQPATLLTPLTTLSWPSSLDLKFEIVTEVGTTASSASSCDAGASPLDGIQRIHANIIEHAFIAYYERHADQINVARSKPGAEGLQTLAFANMIRNAFAHGGIVHFTRDKAGVEVSWAGLSYSERDNGRQIMYRDMSQGDVILLLLEMDGLF
jgi:hypothetical protein